MPRSSLSRPGHFNDHLQRISDAVHESMVTTFEVPAKDRFQSSPGTPQRAVCARVPRHPTQRAGFIQITCNEDARSTEEGAIARLASSIEASGVIKRRT
jgi:hypothetical protein